jgi:hypothetical protein
MTAVATTVEVERLEGYHALLYQKVQQLKPCESCVYHSGSLAADRMNNEQLDRLAKLLSTMADQKLIQLCQRRVGGMYYDYLAIGCR